MLRITLVQKPGQDTGELIACFDQLAGDDASVDTFLQDLFQKYLEVETKVKYEGTVPPYSRRSLLA